MSGFYYDDDGNVRSYADDVAESAGKGGGAGGSSSDVVQTFDGAGVVSPKSAGHGSMDSLGGSGRVGWGSERGRAGRKARPPVFHENMTAIEPISGGMDGVGDEIGRGGGLGHASPTRSRGAGRGAGAGAGSGGGAPMPGAMWNDSPEESKHRPAASKKPVKPKKGLKASLSTKNMKRVFTGWGRASSTPKAKKEAKRSPRKTGGGWKFWKRSSSGSKDSPPKASGEVSPDTQLRTFSGKSLR